MASALPCAILVAGPNSFRQLETPLLSLQSVFLHTPTDSSTLQLLRGHNFPAQSLNPKRRSSSLANSSTTTVMALSSSTSTTSQEEPPSVEDRTARTSMKGGVPDTVLGVLGGSQLGRMLCQAASPMGIKVAVLDPLADCPASRISFKHTVGSFRDTDAVRSFAEGCGVLTVEIEHVDVETLEALASEGADVEPKPFTIRTIQDKFLQKVHFRKNGVALPDFMKIDNADCGERAGHAFGYPLGCVIGGTVYPGLTLTAGTMWWVANSLNIPLSVETVCVFTAPVFSAFAAWSTYALTKEVKGVGAGLTASVLIAIVPSYISRSVAGSYDNEGVAIFALVFTFYLYLKVMSWGGYTFIINLIPMHVLLLIVTGRYSSRLYMAYVPLVVLGTLLAALVPVVGFNAVMTSEHFASFLVFVIIHVVALAHYMKRMLTPKAFRLAVTIVISVGIFSALILIAVLVAMVATSPTGGWSGYSLSLLDPLVTPCL